MKFPLEKTLLLSAAALLGAGALGFSRTRGIRDLDPREAREARGYVCQVCQIEVLQNCTSLGATPCVILSVCTRCTMGFQPSYCVFSINPFDSCTDLGATTPCGNEEVGACNPATGVCTFLGIFLGACPKIANCV